MADVIIHHIDRVETVRLSGISILIDDTLVDENGNPFVVAQTLPLSLRMPRAIAEKCRRGVTEVKISVNGNVFKYKLISIENLLI